MGLSPNSRPCSPTRLRGADPDQSQSITPLSPGGNLARPAATGNARRRRSRCRCCSGCWPASARPRTGRAGAGADARAGLQGPRRCTATVASSARWCCDLRRRRVRPPGTGIEAGAWHVVVARRAARSITCVAAPLLLELCWQPWCSTKPTKCWTWASPEDIELILDPTPPGVRRRCFPRRCAAHRRHRRQAPARSGAGADRAVRRPRRGRCRACARPPTSCSRAHKVAALGRVLDLESPPCPGVRAHAHRGRRA